MKRTSVLLFLSLILITVFVLGGCTPSPSPSANDGNQQGNQNTSSPDFSPTPGIPHGISIESPTVKKGDTFSVFVTLGESPSYPSWCALQFELHYDPELIELVDAKMADSVPSDNVSSISNLKASETSGVVAFASGDDITFFGKIVEIKCTALKAGTCNLEIIDARVYHFGEKEDGTPISIASTVETSNGAITITD